MTDKEKKTILVVDDDESLVALISFLLRDQRMTVLRGKDGIDAFMLTSLHEPSLVLIDLCLPAITGLEVIQQLRHDPAFAVPVVAMSGDPKLLGLALAAGADAVLAKPFTRETLWQVMAEHTAAAPIDAAARFRATASQWMAS